MLAAIQRVLRRWLHHSGREPGMGAAPVQPAFEFGQQLLRKGVQPDSQAVVQLEGGMGKLRWDGRRSMGGRIRPSICGWKGRENHV